MSQIISGLHVDVSSEELRTMLRDRLKHHNNKAAFYQKQLVEMGKVDLALSAEAKEMGKISTQGPMETLKTAVTKHENQATYYKFMSEHVVSNATYRLCEADLVRLGVQSERFY